MIDFPRTRDQRAADFEFIQDGTREGEPIRRQMHQWFIDVLDAKKKSYVIVEGSRERRLASKSALLGAVCTPPLW